MATTQRCLPPPIANSEYLSMLRRIIDGQIRREQPRRLAPLKLAEADAAHFLNQAATYRWKRSSHECCKQARSSTASLPFASRSGAGSANLPQLRVANLVLISLIYAVARA